MIRNALMVLIVSSVTLFSQSKQSQLGFNSNYQIKIGDYSALLLGEFIRGNSKFDAPIICTYEPESSTVNVEIFGSKDRVEGARESMNEYLALIRSTFVPYLQRRFGISVDETNFGITYYDRTASPEPKLILQYIDGQYVVPAK